MICRNPAMKDKLGQGKVRGEGFLKKREGGFLAEGLDFEENGAVGVVDTLPEGEDVAKVEFGGEVGHDFLVVGAVFLEGFPGRQGRGAETDVDFGLDFVDEGRPEVAFVAAVVAVF